MDNIQALIDKRDEFLEKNPHMKALQEKIDTLLEGRTPMQRCHMLQTILLSQKSVLVEKMTEVVNLLGELE